MHFKVTGLKFKSIFKESFLLKNLDKRNSQNQCVKASLNLSNLSRYCDRNE